MIRKAIYLSLFAILMLAGCASMAVTRGDLQQKTSIALDVPMGSFTIYDRQDSGVETKYKVKTQKGSKYSCYVTGSISVVGRIVSDPVCSPLSKTKTSQNKKPCNALLKAAGRCN